MPDSHLRLLWAAGAIVVLCFALASGVSPAQPDACATPRYLLSPKGGPGARFTMLIRINKPTNVNAYARLQSTYGQLRPRDIFVVNTRWKGSNPGEAG